MSGGFESTVGAVGVWRSADGLSEERRQMPRSGLYAAQEIEHRAVPSIRRLHVSAMTYPGERDQHRTVDLDMERLGD